MTTAEWTVTLGMLGFFAAFVGMLAYDLFWKWPRKNKQWDVEHEKFKKAMLDAALPRKVYLLLDENKNPTSFCSTEIEAGLITGATGLTYMAVNRKEANNG